VTAPVKTGGKQTPEAAVEAEIQRRQGESNKQIIDAQWNTLLERMRESGTLDRTLAIVDVSGSMGTISSLPQKKSPHIRAIFPAVALRILLAQISQPPFKDMFITFSASPELSRLQSGSLKKWQNLHLDSLLDCSWEKQVQKDCFIVRIFGSSFRRWLNRIAKAYKKADYEMSEIVYWNLQGGTPKPVLKDTPGTALVTGFSANMVKLFMEGEKIEDEIVVVDPDGEEVQKKANDPIAIMEKALSKTCYDVLRGYD
ncbi:hypothetical protein FRC06_009119, partial [Ceratobasidium sp. 370]